MIRNLVLCDPHNRYKSVEDLLFLLRGLYDRVIILGDYFDSRGDTVTMAENTARWLFSSAQDPSRIHLIGNHDLPYLFPCAANPHHRCPGWTEEKHERIAAIFRGMHLERVFKVAFASGPWLFTHAGVSYSKSSFPVKLQYGDMSASTIASALNEQVPLLSAGKAAVWLTTPGKRTSLRDGDGGPLWIDWSDLVPIPNIMQCVGHTSRLGARYKYRNGGMAVCLDTSPNMVMLMASEGDPERANDFSVIPLASLLRRLTDEDERVVASARHEVATTFQSFDFPAKPE